MPQFIGVLGLGLPELVVIAIILMILTAVVVGAFLLVTWMVRRGSENPAPVPSHTQKKCPDCAEFVRMEARVCKHCGYRFDAAPPMA